MKKIFCIITALFAFMVVLSTTKAESLTSMFDEKETYVYPAHGGDNDAPVLVASFKFKEAIKVNSLNVSYTNSDSYSHSIIFPDLRIVNDTTFQEYDTGKAINENEVITTDKYIYYYKYLNSEEEFAKMDFEKSSYYLEYVTSDNKIISEYGTISKDNKVVVETKRDITEYKKFLDTVSKKYPGVYAAAGDEECTIFVFRPGYVENDENYNYDLDINLGAIFYTDGYKVEDYYKLIEEKLAKIVAKIPESEKVDDKTLAGIKNSKATTTFEQKKDDKVLYAWTFDGTKMTDKDTLLNVNLSLNVGTSANQEKILKLIPSDVKNSLNLDFKHSGSLPVGTKVKVNVAEKFANDKILALYYYNPEKNTLEKVADNLKVSDGYVEFGLEHCSEYVLLETSNTLDNNVQSSSINVLLYSASSIVSLIGIAYIIISKRKTRA